MKKQKLLIFLLIFTFSHGSSAFACQDPIPSWIVSFEIPLANIIDSRKNFCLDTKCNFTYQIYSNNQLQESSVALRSKEPYGSGFAHWDTNNHWNADKSTILLYSRFSFRMNKELIDDTKNLWIEPLGKFTKKDTKSLEKIWPEVFREWKTLKSYYLKMDFTNKKGPHELTLVRNESSLFSCNRGTKVFVFENWRIEINYIPKHCVSIPVSANHCEDHTNVPVIYLLGGLTAILIGIFLFIRR